MLWLTSTKVFALLQGVTCDWIKLPQLYPRTISMAKLTHIYKAKSIGCIPCGVVYGKCIMIFKQLKNVI